MPLHNTMIRKNELFCKLIRIKISSKDLFESSMASFRPEQETCPLCGSSGNCHLHAYYGRRIIDFIKGKPVRMDVTILRLVCGSCGHTHAVLPDPIIPYLSYSLFFILRVLAEAFAGFLTREQLCERFGITAGQLYKWLSLFRLHKQEWLGLLSSAETPDPSFLRRLCFLEPFSDFARGFFLKCAVSFLQSHKNPPYAAP